jgi:hypothetical protein
MTPLGLKILKIHQLNWNLSGTIIRAPELTTWWIPYNLEAIMRYGHSLNSNIPEDPNEAEFPLTPWRDEVTTVSILGLSHPFLLPQSQLVGFRPQPNRSPLPRVGKVLRWVKPNQ